MVVAREAVMVRQEEVKKVAAKVAEVRKVLAVKLMEA